MPTNLAEETARRHLLRALEHILWAASLAERDARSDGLAFDCYDLANELRRIMGLHDVAGGGRTGR